MFWLKSSPCLPPVNEFLCDELLVATTFFTVEFELKMTADFYFLLLFRNSEALFFMVFMVNQ